MITSLKPNEIFVFGSNLAGRHGKGAALQAHKQFGAVYGVGEGFTGQCYAIPTLHGNLRKRSDDELSDSIELFLGYARSNPQLTFLLTKVGCGLAGYPEEYIKAKFAKVPKNVIKPEGW